MEPALPLSPTCPELPAAPAMRVAPLAWGDAHLPQPLLRGPPARGSHDLCVPPTAPLSSAPVPTASSKQRCQPEPARQRFWLSAPCKLCWLTGSAWLGRDRGSEREASAPAGSNPAASPCPAGVPSPARAKPWQGHPQRAQTPWLWQQHNMVIAAQAGIYCQGNQDKLLSCDFNIVVAN